MLSKAISLKFSLEEIKALLVLAEDSIFREKYINPKLPGYRANPEEFGYGQAAVAVLKKVLLEHKAIPVQNNGGFIHPIKH